MTVSNLQREYDKEMTESIGKHMFTYMVSWLIQKGFNTPELVAEQLDKMRPGQWHMSAELVQKFVSNPEAAKGVSLDWFNCRENTMQLIKRWCDE